ncbi:coiled-coil domain-containing protein [Streptomyces sp. NPDC050509]|uniref:coiled-coil domain-containing protein n=1 Tax=Streptomyces sp. NPDC050509 TaxID=3365620 RepID=UPI0037B9214F
MPRGRHRHSPPLHKLLPPTAVAGAAVLCAAGSWLFADPLVLRGLITAAAVAAVSGAVFMRSWDRNAGRRVAELTRGRESDHWKTEERIAELEADVEESRELRAKLDAKLRSKRVELAGLRGEHAALLRRYATAETERATALEGRRQLALEAAAEPKALTAASGGPTKAAYVGAARALDELTRNGVTQQVKRTVAAARARDLAERATEAEEPQGKHAAAAGAEQHSRPASALPASATPSEPPVPIASAIVPYSPMGRPGRRPEGGFDFFGGQCAHVLEDQNGSEDGAGDGDGAQDRAQAGETPADPAEPVRAPAAAAPVPLDRLARVAREDLADVVGEEALAERRRAEERGIGQVIDLTAHDETEQLPLGELRGAISS